MGRGEENVWPADDLADKSRWIRMLPSEAPEDIDLALVAAKRGGLGCEPPNRAIFPSVSLADIRGILGLSRTGQALETAA